MHVGLHRRMPPRCGAKGRQPPAASVLLKGIRKRATMGFIHAVHASHGVLEMLWMERSQFCKENHDADGRS